MFYLMIIFLPIAILLVFLLEGSKSSAKKKECEELREKYSSEFSTKITYICGLPLAENSECILHLCHNEIIIESTGYVYKISREKITDMSIKTSKEVQNSISGAVGGAILLGSLGAFLGGTKTDFHRFFIIIYTNKEGKEQCVSLDMKEDLNALKGIYRYIENFKNNITEKKEIEL